MTHAGSPLQFKGQRVNQQKLRAERDSLARSAPLLTTKVGGEELVEKLLAGFAADGEPPGR